MQTMIENLINGNLTDAKKQAKRFALHKIVDALQNDFGWSLDKAYKAASYLKTGQGFQAYCDAK